MTIRDEMEKMGIHSRSEAQIPAGLPDKTELPPGLFSTPLSCPVEIDTIIGAPHVATTGNLIILPSMQAIPTMNAPSATLHLEPEIDPHTNSGIILYSCLQQTQLLL